VRNIVSFFATRHLLSNVIFFGLILLSIFVWNQIGKEEMPDFSFDSVNIKTSLPGATPEDIEQLVTKVIEKELKTVSGIKEIQSTSSQGLSNFSISIDPNYPDLDEVTQEIKDATLRAQLPSDVRDLPTFRQFKSSEKAIMDIGFTHKTKISLDDKTRTLLQKYALSFENQITSLPEVSSLSRSSYLKPELQILVDPNKIIQQEISLSKVQKEIQRYNIKAPIGSLLDSQESIVTASHELETIENLENLVLQGNDQGNFIYLHQIASVQESFPKKTSITKINGKEGIFFNVKKSISTDILSAQQRVLSFIEEFKKSNATAPIEIIVLDDESFDVVNRLSLISSNGLIGFFLLVSVLFTFLNFQSGFWVAMGVPFSMACTLILAHLTGYTVNNMTLAGVIIVLGIVVDDAIIISENIMRKVEEGLPLNQAIIEGPTEVIKPIVASIATTIVAFLPMLFFEGNFGKFILYIPLVITFMLIASLFESIFILPAHLGGRFLFSNSKGEESNKGKNWFFKYERLYERFILKVLNRRSYVLILFFLLLGGSFYFFVDQMKFVMFPREESRDVLIKVKTPKGTPKEQTAKMLTSLEEIFTADKENVVGLRSSIAKSRRGSESRGNEASVLVELLSAEKREKSLNQLLKEWKSKTKDLKGFKVIKFLRGRWGHSSGSAIEIRVQENNNENRLLISQKIKEHLESSKGILEAEIERPITKKEIIFELNQKNLVRLNVPASNVISVLKSFVEGSILYTINSGEEEVDVRLTVPPSYKLNIQNVLQSKVENNSGNLIPMKSLVYVSHKNKPTSIKRVNFKRTTMVYGDLSPSSSLTPLEIAQNIEVDLFPSIYKEFPNSILKFVGEVEDSRESQGEFKSSIIIVLLLIFLILVVIFNSLLTPLVVLSIVPFGFSGVIYVLLCHNTTVYGFFSVVGALGMMGVIVNDAIIMISKIESTPNKNNQTIANISASRLRPVLLTTITTVVGVIPTAYGWAGFDSMLSEMMLTMGWGLAFGTFITLLLVPIFYTFLRDLRKLLKPLS